MKILFVIIEDNNVVSWRSDTLELASNTTADSERNWVKLLLVVWGEILVKWLLLSRTFQEQVNMEGNNITLKYQQEMCLIKPLNAEKVVDADRAFSIDNLCQMRQDDEMHSQINSKVSDKQCENYRR